MLKSLEKRQAGGQSSTPIGTIAGIVTCILMSLTVAQGVASATNADSNESQAPASAVTAISASARDSLFNTAYGISHSARQEFALQPIRPETDAFDLEVATGHGFMAGLNHLKFTRESNLSYQHPFRLGDADVLFQVGATKRKRTLVEVKLEF